MVSSCLGVRNLIKKSAEVISESFVVIFDKLWLIGEASDCCKSHTVPISRRNKKRTWIIIDQFNFHLQKKKI